MIGYKAFHEGLICRGFQYEIGKTYELVGELEMCKNGFHFCENLVDTTEFYPNINSNIYCKVEALGKIKQQGIKYCTDKIKIIEKVSLHDIELDAKYNSGIKNIGYFNSGDFNVGDCNPGDWNSGRCNPGNRNSGNNNIGDFNSGSYNQGHNNSGHNNHGDNNSGDDNIGDNNSGDNNFGDNNSGNNNRGHNNSGSWNFGSCNSGFFNKTTPTVRLFDKDSGLTYKEFFDLGINLYNPAKSKEIIQKLPGYDAEIFFECTGIDWREDNES